MSYEWAHSGTVDLKPGTTLQHVLNLFPCDGDEAPHLPLTPKGEAELAGGGVWLRVEADQLSYRTGGYGVDLDDQVIGFLEAVAAELAAKGWIDYELEDYEVAYGPSDVAKASAKVESARSAVNSAQTALAAAEDELRRASAGA